MYTCLYHRPNDAIQIALQEVKPAKPAQKRFALLIGNSAYKNYKSLRNSVNDAHDLAKVFHQLGFEVTIKTNLNLSKMKTAIRTFRRKLYKHKQSIGLFYFYGHGTMYNKHN